MILKPNMVIPGSTCPTQHEVDEVVDAMARPGRWRFRSPAPPAAGSGPVDTNVKSGQDALYQRARCDQAARPGDYDPEMETP